MKLTSAPRRAYRVRAVVRTRAAGPISDSRLGRAIGLTQIVLVVLSLARVVADWSQGPLSFEGVIALTLVVSLVGFLAAKAIDRATRQIPGGRGGSSKRRSSSAPIAGDIHADAV
jgi:hypothetical protein